MQNQDKGWSTSLPARKSSGGVDQSIYASPEAAKKHISHDLPPMKCDTEGCETTLAWTKIERILSGKATWRDYHCFACCESDRNTTPKNPIPPIPPRNWKTNRPPNMK
ncbi:MAG TPA: hypothetical protein DEB07_02320 [Candidatus Moranbacteria bacterium]|nr:MAG: hypothetical protein A2194_00110 [Candidatus Moranbacteria bacterium RIFOXYA1_FULL_44_8]OGI35004.1 MAG: hypothetical protein A2407_00595 [Candidatus Moranbacteria bacterium RIFOXYC1_FULL_44_8]HBB36934.1 hypothetical protein [Candidatus Moranbacteria bacterium]HBU25053.1 hypothetical protein [Candidatus Moranbacteria bacterium]